MKRVLKVVVILLMLTMSTEANMAKLMDEDVRQSKVLSPSKGITTNTGSGSKTARQVLNNRLSRLGTPSGLGGNSAPVPNFNTPENVQTVSDYSNIGTLDAQYNAPQLPKWLIDLRNRLSQLGTPSGLGGNSAPVPNFNTEYNVPANYPVTKPKKNKDTYDSYSGQPVNNSYSDLLRSLQPEAIPLGSGDANTSYSDYLRSLVSGSGYPAPGSAPSTSSGFGSSYGSNWRRGYVGGNGGGYGVGYDSSPAWLNAYLRLNNWNIG